MNKLVEALMERDNLSYEEATEIVDGMRAQAFEGEDPEEVLCENGLEPDYIVDLIGW